MAADTLSIADLHRWLSRFHDLVTENRAYLTELDSAIGDADHGANMARGMTAVMEKLNGPEAESVDQLFKTVGMTLVSSVGGASGPLYGTFFLRFGTTVGPVTELDAVHLSEGLHGGLNGVVARGKAEAGDKTMFDAMAPAIDAYDTEITEGADVATAASAAFDAAEAGRDATEPLVARKGRASYLGERSAGHIDPGATSAAYLFQSLAEAIAARGE